MIPRQISLWTRRVQLRYGNRLWVTDRLLFTIIYTTVFTLIAILVKNLVWELYLLAPHPPEEAWMDPREQKVIITYLQKHNQTSSFRPSSMLEYGSGSSTFFFSDYVNHYVSIEHNLDYCRLLERMADSRPQHRIKISYMKSDDLGFYERRTFERNSSDSMSTRSIQIYCIEPNWSMLYQRFWSMKGRSRYSMYKNYVDFVSIHLPGSEFDFVLIDGRARPQVAYVVLKHLRSENAKVFVHDWNTRKGYWIIAREFYDVVDQQIESNQLGGGGLVVLKKKNDLFAHGKLDEIPWRYSEMPSWWL